MLKSVDHEVEELGYVTDVLGLITSDAEKRWSRLERPLAL